MPKKLTSATTITTTSRDKKTKSSTEENTSSTTSTISPNVLLQNIHKLDTKYHITVGTILRKYPSVKLNENKGGIVVNISTLPTEALEEIQKYVDYLSVQQNVLTKIENETNEYKQFFQ